MSINMTPELKKRLKGRKLAKDVIRSITGHITFGDMLKVFRELQNQSQVECATKLGISKQELCNIEKNRKIVSVGRAVIFAKKLKLPPTVFAGYALEDELYRAGIEGEVIIKSVA